LFKANAAQNNGERKRRGDKRRRFAFLDGETDEKSENSDFSLTRRGASTENNEKRKASVSDGAAAGVPAARRRKKRRFSPKTTKSLQKPTEKRR